MKRIVSAIAFCAALFLVVPAAASPETDEADVRSVLQSYSAAVQNLDGASASPLFTTDARIFEQGGDEGTWSVYLKEHLGPEFGEFKSFKFTDYAATVAIEGDLAIASETYRYTIELKEGGDPVIRLGAATSVLRRTAAGWKIIQYHSSSRKPPD